MFKKVLFVGALTMLFGVIVSANPYGYVPSVTGIGSGGVPMTGTLSVSNGGLFSDDTGTASTSANQTVPSADLAGITTGAAVVVRYQTSTNGEQSVSNYDIRSGSLTASATKSAPNDYGTYATGGHTYSSSKYGTWSGSTSLDF